VGTFFGINIGVWVYLRHYLNLRIIFSLFSEFRTVGPYELDWDAQQYKCLLSNVITLALLAGLQSLNLFWLYCLLRSAYRFVVYNVAKDDRSETEESEAEGPEQVKQDPGRLPAEKVTEPRSRTKATARARRQRIS
jgi:very-long-chain ceramide synthase